MSKRNKFGMTQSRVIVLNASAKAIFLLDDKRKMKKKFKLSEILQLEVRCAR